MRRPGFGSSGIGDSQDMTREVPFSHPGDPGGDLSGVYVLTTTAKVVSVWFGWMTVPGDDYSLGIYLDGVHQGDVVSAGQGGFAMVDPPIIGDQYAVLQIAFNYIHGGGSGPTVHVNLI